MLHSVQVFHFIHIVFRMVLNLKENASRISIESHVKNVYFYLCFDLKMSLIPPLEISVRIYGDQCEVFLNSFCIKKNFYRNYSVKGRY